MTIHQRAPLDGILVDVACIGRFYDFFEKRDADGPLYDGSRSMKKTVSTG